MSKLQRAALAEPRRRDTRPASTRSSRGIALACAQGKGSWSRHARSLWQHRGTCRPLDVNGGTSSAFGNMRRQGGTEIAFFMAIGHFYRRRAIASKAILVVGTLAGMVAFSRTTFAAPSDADRALATELFEEARALMAQQKYAEACPKFAESQRLDPGGGTLLNLALCHEQDGKTATAWAELHEALALAERAAFEERIQIAREHIAALEPKLSRITIVVPAEVAQPNLTVRRDGTELPRAAWGTSMPVDPGEHRIEISAPGYKPWSTTVEIGAAPDVRQVVVPPLKKTAPKPETKPAAVPKWTAAPKRPPERDVRPHETSGSSLQRTLGFTTGGVGVVGLGVGGFFGLRAISKDNERDHDCELGCTPKSQVLADQATTAADIATISITAGLVALGVGAYLLLTD